MRWRRSVEEDDDLRRHELAELEASHDDPARRTWALLAAAEQPESPECLHASSALEKWPPRLWLELDAVRLDAWIRYDSEVAPAAGWKAALAQPEASTLLLVLASTHRDGYLRERATRLLIDRADSLAAAALAVRAVDHVTEVREVARQALAMRQPDEDAAVVVPILLATQPREVAAGAFEAYLQRLSPETLRSLAHSHSKQTRRFAIEHAPLTPAELVQIAATDSDLGARLAAARRALAQDEDVAGDLLAVAPASVRALAVSVAAEKLVRPRLEQMLLDRSAHLRRAAQSRARTLDVDAAALYRDRLPTRAAILGLGETGSDTDTDRLTALLDEQQLAPVRRAAIQALARIAPREPLLTLLPPLLGCDQPSVAREAGRQLHRIGYTFSGEALEHALTSPYPWTRRTALRIALGHRGWDTPLAALSLYDDQDESLREHARAALNDWLARKAASAQTPTAEQANRLTALLDRVHPSSHLERQIRFHAGLATTGHE